jgi:hypothetical protein
LLDIHLNFYCLTWPQQIIPKTVRSRVRTLKGPMYDQKTLILARHSSLGGIVFGALRVPVDIQENMIRKQFPNSTQISFAAEMTEMKEPKPAVAIGKRYELDVNRFLFRGGSIYIDIGFFLQRSQSQDHCSQVIAHS